MKCNNERADTKRRNIPPISEAIKTPSLYLIATIEVPVTYGYLTKIPKQNPNNSKSNPKFSQNRKPYISIIERDLYRVLCDSSSAIFTESPLSIGTVNCSDEEQKRDKIKIRKRNQTHKNQKHTSNKN